MKVYVVLWEDRHTDPVIEAYQDRLVAMKRATEIAKMEEYPQAERKIVTGWELYFHLSEEGDSVRVEEVEVA